MSCPLTASGFPCEGVSDASIETSGGSRLGRRRNQLPIEVVTSLVAATFGECDH